MTRAEDHLVVSLHRALTKATFRPSLADQVAALLEPVGGHYVDWAERPRERATQLKLAAPAELRGPAADAADLERWQAGREALVEMTRRPRSVGASELDANGVRWHRAASASSESLDEPGDAARWRSPRAASALGRAVHGVLQRVDLADRHDLAELARVEADREGCVDAVDAVTDLALRALDTPSVVAAAEAAVCWRELPVSIPLGDGILDGVLDLAYVIDDQLTVVDYKTDVLVDDDDLARATTRYRLQAGAYALALSAVLGRRVDRCCLVFVAHPDGPVESEIVDLDAAVADAERRVAELFSGALA